MTPLLEQVPNTRFMYSSGPAHQLYIYKFGENVFYDSAKVAEKKEDIVEKFDKKIEETEKEAKEQRLVARKLRKVAKKDKTLREGNLLMRWGEPLSVYDSAKSEQTIESMSNYMKSLGYYANKVSYSTEIKGKEGEKINVKYNVTPGEPYVIDSLQMHIPDWRVKELITSFNEGHHLRKGQVLKTINISAERDRIYNIMINSGYYEFSKSQIHFEIDSVTLGSPKSLIVRQVIASPADRYYHKKYVVDSVIFVTDAGGSTAKGIPNEEYKDITYTYGRFKYSSKILNWHNQLYPGFEYKRNVVLETQRQLSYLDNFKFINVNFDTLGSEFVAHIFTSPADRYQTSTETGFSVTQGLPGPFATVNLKNRNLFHGLEITELNTFFKLEGNPGVTTQEATYSSVQYGTELSITFPQFLSPLGRFYKKRIAKFNPRTRFALAFNREDRLNEYNRSQLNATTSYIWKVQDHVSYTLTPMMIGYIDSQTEPAFQAVLDELSQTSKSFASTFNSSFVSAGSFTLTVNDNYGVTRNSNYFQFYTEVGGHLLSLFGQDPFGPELEYFKYSKVKFDIRRMHQVNRRTSIAMRLNIGAALPYGDNEALPYEKYFFGGGSNSVRAWKPRRLGPGAFGIIDDSGNVDYTREQPGDLFFEANAEIRHRLPNSFVNLALFMDMGNIWLLRSQTVDPSLDPEGDDGIFNAETFLSEIAVGSGFGLRFDLSILIFRLDLGWKLLDPAQPPGKRWVGDDIFPKPLRSVNWNIGIGYPF